MSTDKTERDGDRKKAINALTTMLLAGLDSGAPVPFTNGHFKEKKNAIARRFGKKSRRS